MTERILGPTGSERRRRFYPGALLVAVLLAILVVPGALAVHDKDFELDGNLSVQAGGPAFDWESFFNASGASVPTLPSATRPNFTSSGFQKDFSRKADGSFESTDETTFTTGSKDTLNISTGWQCVGSNNVNDKDTILNGYAVSYTDPANGDKYLYFGLERFANNGDANIAFWFLQDGSVGCEAVGLGGGGTRSFTGDHKDGDLLIVAAFTKGGDVTGIDAYKWSGGASGSLQVSPKVASGADCSTASGGDAICAESNKVLVTPIWDTARKSGGTTVANLDVSEFFEGGINLTKSGLQNSCFNDFVGVTRSSQSLTATLFDYARGSLPLCDASVTIAPSEVDAVGEHHTFTLTATQRVAGTPTPATDGHGRVTLTAGNGLVASDIIVDSSTCEVNTTTGTNDNLDANGQCTVEFHSTKPGTVTGHGSVSLNINGTVFNKQTDGVGANSGDAVKRYVDAKIDLSPLTDTDPVGDQHTITATVQQDDGLAANTGGGDAASGFGPAASKLVTFSLVNNVNNNTSFVGGVSTCTTNASGQCSIQITSSVATSVDVHATTTFSIGPAAPNTVSVTRSTATTGNSADAHKVFVDARVKITPDDTNGIGDPHTFTVEVDQNAGDGNGFVDALVGNVDVTLTNGGSPGAVAVLDAAASTCDDSQPDGDNLDANGKCTVKFTSNTGGTVTGNATVHLTVGGVALVRDTDPATGTIGSGPGGTGPAVKTFIQGSLAWFKVDQDALPLGGATFKVCRTRDWDSDADVIKSTDLATPVCFNSVPDVESASPPAGDGLDQDGDKGELKLTHLLLGRYTIEEVSAPPGYAKDTSVHGPFDLTEASPDGVDLVKFVNSKLFKMIVITCNESLNELVVSTVTVTGQNGGVAKDTIGAVPAPLAAKTVTQSDLCGIGGAAFGGLKADTYSASVVIPKP